MGYIAIDLGTTNTKVAAYNNDLEKLGFLKNKVKYTRTDRKVEFDAEDYFNHIVTLIKKLVSSTNLSGDDSNQIILTGQAETLVIIGIDGRPLIPAISWMDERSVEESEHLMKELPFDEYHKITGQCVISPTWPATKILHIRKHLPDVFDRAYKYILLKDYIAFRLTGVCVSEISTATFTFYTDIFQKKYWGKMLSIIGIREEQLPPLIEPCTNIGCLKPKYAEIIGLRNVSINIGTLDHFSGMIGAGAIDSGSIAESTGTVMTLAAFVKNPVKNPKTIAVHYGPFPDSYVSLAVAESGGICLEWFRNNFIADMSFSDIDREASKKNIFTNPMFLPYISGVNSPEYDHYARGLFFGIRTFHDQICMALSVMEGVAYLLARNINEMKNTNTKVDRIISTGGGASSDLWLQLKANITGIPVLTPVDKEVACLGAGIIGAVENRRYNDYKSAIEMSVKIEKQFNPQNKEAFEKRRLHYDMLYDAMIAVSSLINSHQ